MHYRTNASRREAADTTLKEHPDWSDAHIATHCKVSTTLVYKRRKLLIEQKTITDIAQRIGVNGKTYEAGMFGRKGGIGSDPSDIYTLVRIHNKYALAVITKNTAHSFAILTAKQAAHLIAQGHALLTQA